MEDHLAAQCRVIDLRDDQLSRYAMPALRKKRFPRLNWLRWTHSCDELL